MTEIIQQAAIRDIGTMTLAETGWKRLDSQTMRWTGQPLGGDGGRDVLELRGRGTDLVITSGYLPAGTGPDDGEAVAEDMDGWSAALPLPALVVLHHAIGSCIRAMEDAQGVSISCGNDDISGGEPGA